MTSMKQVRLAVVFLIVAAPSAATPALAAGGGSTNLTCLVGETDPDYGAWGVAKVSGVKYTFASEWGPVYRGKLSVLCRDLTPGTTYNANFGEGFTASASGGGTDGGEVYFFGRDHGVGVAVTRSDGVVILGGFIPLSLD